MLGCRFLYEVFTYKYIAVRLGFKSTGQFRAGGFSPHNFVALFLNICIMFTVGAFLAVKGWKKKALLLIPLLVMVEAHFLTKSRAGLMGLMAGLLAFFLLGGPAIRVYLRRHFFKTVFLVLAGISVLFIMSHVSTGRLSAEVERLSRSVSTAAEEASFEKRLTIWKAGAYGLYRSYGLGVGIGGLRRYVSPWGQIKAMSHAHNIYLSVLIDLGFVGFFILGWLIFELTRSTFSALKRCRKDSLRYILRASIAGLVAIGVHGLMDFSYINETLWLGIGIAVATARLADSSIQGPLNAEVLSGM
jgi:O-antigen ligase